MPKKMPNFNHALFKCVKILELNKPSKRKIIEINKLHILNSSPWIKGQIEIIKKNPKKTKPKLLFDEIFILLLSNLIS